MPRMIYDGREVDPNFQIEDAVQQALRANNVAHLSRKAIDANYELLDEDLHPIPGTFEEKCLAIAKIVGAEVEFRGDSVLFRKKRRIGF